MHRFPGFLHRDNARVYPYISLGCLCDSEGLDDPPGLYPQPDQPRTVYVLLTAIFFLWPPLFLSEISALSYAVYDAALPVAIFRR